MTRKLTLTLVSIVLYMLAPQTVFSQVPPCGPGQDITGETCGETCIPCEDGINGYMNTVPVTPNPTAPNPLCNGQNVPNNTQWLAFVAGSTNVTLSIAWGNCSNGTGMQAGIIGDCGALNNSAVVCSGACPGPNPIVLATNSLIPGQDYFIWIDGCGGASCDYTISVLAGTTIYDTPPAPTVAPTGSLTGCPGGNPLPYFTSLVANATDYNWTIDPLADFTVNPDGTLATVNWGAEGTYTVCVQAVNACFESTIECIDVEVTAPTETFLGPEFYCTEDPGYIYPGNGMPYGIGDHEIHFTTALGCDSIVNLEVDVWETDPGQIDTAICFGDFFLLDGNHYNTPLNNVQIPLGPAHATVNGCDSSVVVNLAVVRPTITGFNVPETLNCSNSNSGTVIFVNSPQLVSPFATWEWDTVDGVICDGNTTSPILFVCEPGWYYVTLTLTDPNQYVECTMVDSVLIVADFEPPTLTGSAMAANCGQSVGSATVMVSNTTMPMIAWDSNTGNQTTATATNLAPGSYWVTVTGANGCLDSLEVTVPGTPPIGIMEETIVPASCNGASDGSATISLIDAVGTSTITWSPGSQTGLTATGLAAGVYTVMVTDGNGCTADAMITITEPTAVDMTSVTLDSGLDCNGDTDASATATGVGGTGTLNYQWDANAANQTTATATNLGVGTYSVTVTDANGCSDVGSVTITAPAVVEITNVLATNLACNGDTDASATATGVGGTGMLNYQWGANAANQTGATATGLGAGTYSVTATDANGCTDVGSVTITDPTLLEMQSVTATSLACNGDTNASATAAGAGGTGALSYQWGANAANQTGPTATNLGPGTYSVTVTDANGCTDVGSVMITAPNAVSMDAVTATNLACNGDANASATATGLGGTGSLMYQWDANAANQTGATATNLGAGTYNVTVTDANGCTDTGSVTITEPPVVDMTSVMATNLACNGDANASATATGLGGTGTLMYQWDANAANQTGATATNLGAGTYNVTVTDANGCTDTGSVTITDPTVVDMTSVVATTLACGGDMNASATATGVGGTGTLMYQWDANAANQTGATATNLGAGTYSVTVTDGNGCTDTGSVTIADPIAVSMDGVVGNSPLCNGGTNGTATATGSGGTGTLSYQWGANAANQTGATASNLGAGTYNVTVTDSNGCTDVGSVTITEPTAVMISGVTATDVNCNGDNNASATATGLGGTGALTYQWDANAANQTGATASNLGAGTYSVTATDANGCTDVGSVTITDPPIVDMMSVTATTLACNGDATASATAAGVGGTGGLTYQWDANAANQTGATASNLGAGTYNVTVTDANGCTDIGSVTITEPVLLEMTNVSATSLACGGDTDASATATGVGGTGALTYQWGANAANQTGATASNLGAGTYNVTVTDANGCTDTGSVTITEPSPVALNLIDSQDLKCFGDDDGSATVEASGGTAPYDYQWDANAGGQATASATQLVAGSYTVTVTDALGCVEEIMVTLTEPAAPLAASTDLVMDATCGVDNGSISITVTGGTGTISYLWSASANSQTTATASNLGAGTYSVTITDQNNCKLIYSETVSTPNNFVANVLQVDPVSCYGGSDGNISVNISGGTSPYTFLWDYAVTPDVQNLVNVPAGDYSLTVTDSDGCEITLSTNVVEPAELNASAVTTLASCGLSDGNINMTVTGGNPPYTYAWTGGAAPVQDPTNLPAGNYEVTITDAKMCERILQTTISVPNGPQLAYSQEDAKCFQSNTGSIQLNITGGTPPFTYDWSGGMPAPPVANPGNLPAGVYEVEVIDVNNCSITQTITITEPTELVTMVTNIVPATCGEANGSVTIDIAGGVPPYTFLWNGSIVAEDPTMLPAGDYNLVATDANGCTATAFAQVIPPDGLSFQPTDITEVSCFGGNDGAIQLNVTGGVPPFTYSWSPPQGNIPNPSGLTGGIYLATVTDANGCPLETSVSVPEPPVLAAQSFGVDASCANDDGAITLQVQGGTGTYTYNWQGPNGFVAGTQNLTGLEMGDYDATITDINGCTYELSETISIPDAPMALASVQNVACFGDNSGTISVLASGGSGVYNYNWSGGIAANTPIANSVGAGTYSVTVTDTESCSFVLNNLVVTEPTELLLSGTTTQATCNQNNGTVTASASGGTTPYTYTWSPALPNSPNQTGLGIGSYTLTVTDAQNCTVVESFVVGSPDNLAAMTSHVNVTCFGGNDGSITLTASGGTSPFTFMWDNGIGMVQNPQNLPANTYNVVVTDANGCTVVSSATITQPPLIEITTVSTTDATCGVNNGAIDISVIGGTGAYSYNWTNSAGTPVSTDEDPKDLGAGVYLATVTDASGCTMTFSESVLTPNMPTVATSSDSTSCFAGSDGNVEVILTGGIPPFTFTWNDPQYTGSVLNNVPAGTYLVTITDGDNCTFTDLIVVGQPEELLATNQIPQSVSCNGENDAEAVISVTGGTKPYQYDWDNNSLDGQAAPTGLTAGTYTLTVIDAKGCEVVESFEIIDPPLLESSITGEPANCFGAADGSILVIANGGTGIYLYNWSGGLDPIANPTDVAAGTYQVTVSDANNCTTVETFEVEQPTEVLLEVESISNYAGFNVSCAESTDGSVTVTATGGTAPYSYVWQDGTLGALIEDLGPGEYLVTVTDAKDCPFEERVNLTSPEPVSVTADVVPIQCNGDANGMIFVDQVSGGASPYLYSLNGSPFGSGVFPGLSTGLYYLEAEDANGCSWLDSIFLTEPVALDLDLVADTEILYGDSTVITPITDIPLSAIDTFVWSSPGVIACPECFDILVKPEVSTPYTLMIRDENNCVIEDQIMIRVKKERLVYIPSGFTPQGDDPRNSTFMIYAGRGVVEITEFYVYDRWGEIVFQNQNFQPNDPLQGWDGTLKGELMNPAVFVYVAKVRFNDNSVELYKGDVTLIR